MSKGLGTVQRALLLAAARMEERHPLLSVETLIRNACEHELHEDLRRRKAEAKTIYQAFNAAHPDLDAIAEEARALTPGLRRDPRGRDPRWLEPGQVSRDQLERWYNPSRALAALVERGFVVKELRYYFLTDSGLVEAVRLGLRA